MRVCVGRAGGCRRGRPRLEQLRLPAGRDVARPSLPAPLPDQTGQGVQRLTQSAPEEGRDAGLGVERAEPVVEGTRRADARAGGGEARDLRGERLVAERLLLLEGGAGAGAAVEGSGGDALLRARGRGGGRRGGGERGEDAGAAAAASRGAERREERGEEAEAGRRRRSRGHEEEGEGRKKINLAYSRNIPFYGVGIRGLLARTSFRPVESEYRALYSRYTGQKFRGSVRHALTSYR